MTTVYCKATTPPKLLAYGHIFNYVSDFKIYIPKSEGSTVLKAYKSAKGWKDYARIIEEYDYDNRQHVIHIQQHTKPAQRVGFLNKYDFKSISGFNIDVPTDEL